MPRKPKRKNPIQAMSTQRYMGLKRTIFQELKKEKPRDRQKFAELCSKIYDIPYRYARMLIFSMEQKFNQKPQDK